MEVKFHFVLEVLMALVYVGMARKWALDKKQRIYVCASD